MNKQSRLFSLRYALSHGALPAGVLGALADFGTPVGLHWFGWALAAMYLISLALLVALPAARERAYDFMCAPDEARRSPFLINPFAWALLVGAAIAGSGGALSYLSRDEGGFLASNVEILREMQTTNLLLAKSLEVQEEISGKIDALKQETSEDPAKELANLGFEMSPNGIQSAIALGNVDAIKLYAKAGSKVSAASFGINYPGAREQMNPVWQLVSTANEPMAQAIARLGTSDDAVLCFASPGFGRGAAGILSSQAQQQAFRTLCAGGEAEKALRAAWDQRKQLQQERPARTAACEREAASYLSSADPVTDAHQLSRLSMSHQAKLSSGGDALRVDEAAANLAMQGGAEPVINGSRTSYRVPRAAVPMLAQEACAQVLDPTHPSNLFATLDEDYRAMIAALDQ